MVTLAQEKKLYVSRTLPLSVIPLVFAARKGAFIVGAGESGARQLVKITDDTDAHPTE